MESTTRDQSDDKTKKDENGEISSRQAEGMANALYAKLRSDRAAGLPLRDEDAARLAGCAAFRFGVGDALAGWEIGEGPLVYLVHGWGGRGAQMSGLAHLLAGHDFRVVFFDAGSHGESGDGEMGFDRFMEDAAALQHHIGQTPYAWVGHSAGALAIMRGRRTHGIRADRYACLAAPFLPYVPIERMRAMGAPEPVLDRIKPMIADQFSCSWTDLENGMAWERDADAPLMIAYDSDDKVVRPGDGDRIARIWPEAHLVRTEGHGHNRILGSEAVIHDLLDHLSPH
ncbi:alpha/beta fold hydrolase [Parasphingopyxis lamellibrachiae]|uniref:Serine aminopeptidase S33 family n=1 Tax=Parasphingopyxis lamellibrachiae TaxID=680125 RepID=A0A3D9FFJ3_9SPHN|nr:alpha/beta hydrolase [Parasphingopyxis lamellibrachiae]RED16595.1 serine aminopeptidase S33 family [Parasphingopyxis lamellibrachiae]